MNYREHPKFIFIKNEIERYISKGELLGKVWLENPDDVENKAEKIRRCPLGVVAFNYNLIKGNSDESYEDLLKKFGLSSFIGIGFDRILTFKTKSNPSDEDLCIGEEIGLLCIENNWIENENSF